MTPLAPAAPAVETPPVPVVIVTGLLAVSAAPVAVAKSLPSERVTVEFWMTLPVVPSKRTTALSVDEPGPVTSPAPAVAQLNVLLAPPLLDNTWLAVGAVVGNV